jgi:2-deoxy-D-gluconate 3-dehydrogenase
VDLRIADHVAIVTGASRGLGAAIVRGLVAEGVRVVATARTRDALDTLAAEHPGRIVPVACDLSDAEAVEKLADDAIAHFGRLDILVNNAGIAPAERFQDSTAAGLAHVLAVNVIAPAVLARICGAIFLGQHRGKIVNIASISGIRGKAGLVAYSASKGAMVRLTEALAAEWARHGVQVNAIAPGAFETEAQQAVLDNPETLARRISKIPARRVANPTEISALACYLASPLSDFVTGATYVIDGGESSKI